MSKSFRLVVSLATLLVTIVAIPLRAGWRERYPIYGGGIAVIAVDAGGDVYAVGSGGVFRFDEGTQQWSSALGDLPTTAIAVLTPDPVQVGTLYAGTDKGLYRTTDRGSTWTRLPLNLPGGITITAVVVAPANTDRLFVATWGSYVWRSFDHGATWSQSASGLTGGWGGPAFIPTIAADPTNANRVYTNTWRGRLFRSDDAAATWTPIADASTWTAYDLYVSRSHPNVLYMTHDEYWFGRGTVLRSSDYGDTWTNAGRPAPYVGQGTNVGKLAIHPTDPNIVYVTTGQGLHKTTTGGGTWTRAFYPPTGQSYLPAVAIDAGTPARIFAGSAYTGFYRTTDGGASWSQQNDGMAVASISGLGLCRDVPSTIYAAAQGVGIVKSADAGDTWAPVATALNGQSYGGLAVHPQNPNIFVTTSGDGTTSRIWRSIDGGATVAQTSINYGPFIFRFNPLDPSYIHAPISDWQGGFLRSADAGGSFSVPYWWYIYPTDFVFHPAHPNIVFSVAFQYTGNPQNTLWIVWSNDYGASWTGTSFGRGHWEELALDQNAPGTLYAVGRMPSEGTEGAYKFSVSYSGASVTGVTRVPGTFNNGLGSVAVRRLHYDKTNGYLYASTPAGVYRSGDGMATWTSINDGLPYPSTDWMAGTPDGQHLYVATSGGIWEYSDALPVPVAVPVVRSTPSDLLQTFVVGQPGSISVLGETTTAADTIGLTSSALAPNMTFVATPGNPATGALTFIPAQNQRGQTYEISFTATSTLEPANAHTISHYLSVIGSTTTDAAVLIGAGSDGAINTPDGNFSLDIPAGAIPGPDRAAVNVAYESNYKQADVNAHLPGQRPGKITVLSAYDITIDGLDHFTFASPVALTFHYDAGVDPANIIVMTYNEATRNFEPRTDTSCLAYFGRQPVTGSMATGGTISVCTSTVSVWAIADATTYVSVDTTPPSISIAVPADGAVYLLNQAVTASYSCTDAESGVATCSATAIDTATAGAHTFTVTATDNDGNSATASTTYFVRYAFSGFLPPLKTTAKAGQVIPIKWQLRDVSGAFIGNVAAIVSLRTAPIACGATPVPFAGEPATYAGNALPRYDAEANQFVVNWQTKKEWSGCRALQLTLDDGARYFLVVKME